MEIKYVHLKGQDEVKGYNNPNKIILHHPEFYGSVVALNDMMRTMGFSMIGYNYYVRKDGSVWKGRPDNVTSANCFGQNNQSLGVCFEGNYAVDKSMPQAQFDAGVELIQFLMNKYGISEVNGHKAYYNTDCPAKNFPLSEMLQAVKGQAVHVETPKSEASGLTARVTASELNVRSGASTDYERIGKVFDGETVECLDVVGNWYYIKYDTSHGKKCGWVSGSYLDKSFETKTVTASKLNVRSGAGVNFDKIGSLENGESAMVKRTENGWANVIYNTNHGAKEGWVSCNYLQ